MALAGEGDYLILADGTKIAPTGQVVKEKKYSKFVEVPAPSEAQAIVAKSRRAIGELPMPPAQMNTVSLVLFYTMWGLSDNDCALATGLSIPQVKNIKKLPEFIALSDDIKKSVLEHEAGDVRAMLASHASNAAQRVIDTMDEEGALGFAAAKDILDRAGHRPADVVEHKHKMDDSLKIEFIVKNPAADQVPVLNVTDYHEV